MVSDGEQRTDALTSTYIDLTYQFVSCPMNVPYDVRANYGDQRGFDNPEDDGMVGV